MMEKPVQNLTKNQDKYENKKDVEIKVGKPVDGNVCEIGHVQQETDLIGPSSFKAQNKISNRLNESLMTTSEFEPQSTDSKERKEDAIKQSSLSVSTNQSKLLENFTNQTENSKKVPENTSQICNESTSVQLDLKGELL